jgi:hypothetical protein
VSPLSLIIEGQIEMCDVKAPCRILAGHSQCTFTRLRPRNSSARAFARPRTHNRTHWQVEKPLAYSITPARVIKRDRLPGYSLTVAAIIITRLFEPFLYPVSPLTAISSVTMYPRLCSFLSLSDSAVHLHDTLRRFLRFILLSYYPELSIFHACKLCCLFTTHRDDNLSTEIAVSSIRARSLIRNDRSIRINEDPLFVRNIKLHEKHLLVAIRGSRNDHQ